MVSKLAPFSLTVADLVMLGNVRPFYKPKHTAEPFPNVHMFLDSDDEPALERCWDDLQVMYDRKLAEVIKSLQYGKLANS